ncbi:hypothetical protein MMC13_000336 [Lambiella insularis]|nr:hypothetical protein [Lambiella insularis]
MATHDSDSSDEESEQYTTTDVLLGYASKEPTSDRISQLGGRPTWLHSSHPPSSALARCKVCNDYMLLLLQLHGDLPEYFPGHERRLYVFGCKRRTCRRREGSMRAIRNVRAAVSKDKKAQRSATAIGKPPATTEQNLGNSIFGVTSAPVNSRNANPFSSSTGSSNPFSSSPFSNHNNTTSPDSAISKQSVDDTSDLRSTFASKVSLSSSPYNPSTHSPPEHWPADTSLPVPYPSYHLDADYETLDIPSQVPVPGTTMMDLDDPGAASSAKEDADTFESTIDKTFQRFADRLAQNPLQVLRYEFRGFPLLYSKTDNVGKLLAPYQPHSTSHGSSESNSKLSMARRDGSASIGIPPCENCGAGRVFELQLTPQAITELEVKEEGLEGMEWGNVVVGVCGVDCGGESGDVGYVEEWVGVQWEERGKP